MIIVFCMCGLLFFTSLQNAIKKIFTKKFGQNCIYLFNAILSFAAMLSIICTTKSFSFNTSYFGFSLLYAVFYAIASIFFVFALMEGAFSLSSLFLSYSSMIPTFYGLIFLKESISVGFIPGLLSLVLSIFLMNKTNSGEKISYKWLLYIILAFFGNGMLAVVKKIQIISQNGEHTNEFMALSLFFVCVFFIIVSFIKERGQIKSHLNYTLVYGFSSGLAHGIATLLTIILLNKISISLMYPIISSGSIIISFLWSQFVFKEKLTKKQFIGFILGIVSVICLNL